MLSQAVSQWVLKTLRYGDSTKWNSFKWLTSNFIFSFFISGWMYPPCFSSYPMSLLPPLCISAHSTRGAGGLLQPHPQNHPLPSVLAVPGTELIFFLVAGAELLILHRWFAVANYCLPSVKDSSVSVLCQGGGAQKSRREQSWNGQRDIPCHGLPCSGFKWVELARGVLLLIRDRLGINQQVLSSCTVHH